MKELRLLIIDGQGGKIGKLLAEKLLEFYPKELITVVGTQSMATVNMLKAGKVIAATGENAIKFNAKKADIIVGAIGIVIPNALHGEISPDMAVAVGSSDAIKYLIPLSNCGNNIVGVKNKSISTLINEACMEIREYVS